jgi:hypothetical protein
MAEVEKIEVIVSADDSELLESFENIAKQSEDLQESADDLSGSLDKAFKPRQVQQYGKALDGTTKQLDKQDKQVKKNNTSMSTFNKTGGRGVSMLSRFGGIGGKATRSLGGLSFALAGTPFGAFALAGAAATAAYSLFTKKVTESKKDIEDAVEAIGELNLSITDLEKDIRKANIALLFTDEEKAISDVRDISKEIRDLTKEGRNIQNEINEISAKETTNRAEKFKKQEELAKLEEKSLQNQVKILGLNEELNKNIADRAAKEKAAAEEASRARKAATDQRAKDEKDLQSLFDSLIRNELEKRLKALEVENTARKERAKDLKLEKSEIDRFLKSSDAVYLQDKKALEKEFADAKIKAQQALFSQLAIDEEKALKAAAVAAKKQRDLEIVELFTDESEKAELIKQNEIKLQNDLDVITKQFADKRKQEGLAERQEIFSLESAALETQIANNTALLDKRQEEERIAFASIARSEEEITAFKEQQDKAKLESELNYQIQRLQLVRDFNTEINEAERMSLDAQIDALETRLSGIGAKVTKTAEDGAKKGDGLFGLLGISSDTQANVQAVQGALEQATSAVSQAVAERIDLYDKEIQKKNEVISEKQKDLANEIELNKLGKASNIALLQNELAIEKQERDKAEKDREEAAKAQFILDTALQSSNLITAISGLYSSLSGLPFGIGVALATALTGVMIGTFVASKASAASAAGFYEGTENVEKALGKQNARHNGKDGYRGKTKSGKIFDFDGGERIFSAADNLAIGDMTNAEARDNAILGAAISGNMPNTKQLALKNKQLNNQQRKNERLKEARLNQAHSNGIVNALTAQHGTLKEILNRPIVIPMPNGTTKVIKGNTEQIYKQ